MNQSRFRAALVFWALFIGFLAVGVRLVSFQLNPDARLAERAERKEQWDEERESKRFLRSRGKILDRQGNAMALSLVSKSIFANPRQIKEPQKVASQLSPVLGVSREKLEKRLEKDLFFVWLKRQVNHETARAVERLKIPGVYHTKESKRRYPYGNLGKSVIGFSGRDGVGLEGVEKSYDHFLQVSDQASGLGVRDALGRLLLYQDFDRQWFESYDVELTLDMRLQKILEEELRQSLNQTNAVSVQGVMMEPETGAILAMTSLDGERAESSYFRNRVVSDVYEPGSTFKTMVTVASIRELGLKPESQVYAEKGEFEVGRRKIREYNHREFEWISLQEMLALSSNIGAAKLGLEVGASALADTIRRFGFGKETGIDVPGEAGGILRDVEQWRTIDLANISFGQGVAVTPLQLARSFAAFANGGYLVKPHVVARVVASESDDKPVWQAQASRDEIVSSQLARQMTEMLTSVTEDGGTGVRAAIPGYSVAGKTGTSQKLEEKEMPSGIIQKVYSRDASIASFVGYVPAYDPAFVLFVLLDDPEGRSSGGLTAAPVFKKIAQRSLGVLGIQAQPKDREPKIATEAVSERAGRFVGQDFQEVLHEIRQWEEEERERVELYGFGRAVREEIDDSSIKVYFE